MAPPNKKTYPRLVSALIETFGLNPILATVLVLLMTAVAVGAIAWFVSSAPPRTLVITSGPPGSTYQRFANAYAKILAKNGVTLRILESKGSQENLQRLKSGQPPTDIGFVLGGIAESAEVIDLESLGSVGHQPVWVFHRGSKPVSLLSELAGRRVAVGTLGSGTHAIALKLLAANGITGDQATLLELDADIAAAELQEGRLDAIFLMGDSAPLQTLRNLVRAPDIQLFTFAQADAYVRRHPYLHRIELPQGSIDLGRNLPARDVVLVGPNVQLVARQGLHPALCDLLLDVAQEVHGRSSLLQRRGEFPAPLETEFLLSADALRYYKSGKGFISRTIRSFWLASLINRILVVFVPTVLVMVPTIRLLPFVYRWCIQLRLIKCYRPLLLLERDVARPLTHEQGVEMLRRLDEIEEKVNHLQVPASFADQFYILRVHVAFVRERLKSATPG